MAAGTPTVMPTMPASTRCLNRRAALPGCVKIVAPLPKPLRLIVAIASSSSADSVQTEPGDTPAPVDGELVGLSPGGGTSAMGPGIDVGEALTSTLEGRCWWRACDGPRGLVNFRPRAKWGSDMDLRAYFDHLLGYRARWENAAAGHQRRRCSAAFACGPHRG